MKTDLHEALIFEAATFAQNRLATILIDQGFSEEKIYKVSSINDFSETLTQKNINIVFADHSVWTTDVVSLMDTVKKKKVDLDIFVVLLCSTASKELLFKAAQKGVNYFIPKPYKNEKVRACVQDYFVNFDSRYLQLIKKAKAALAANLIEEARKDLNLAVTIGEKPLEAYYYLAKIDVLEGNLKKAIKKLNTCLEFNDMNLDCLTDLFEIHFTLENRADAYEIGKILLFNFPLNENIITKIIRLCVQTASFNDMIQIHQAIVSFKQKQQDIVNYLGSGLYVAGKNYLMNKKPEGAIICFDYIRTTCSQFSKFLRAIIFLLVEYEKVNHAKKYLELIEASDQKNRSLCEFAVKNVGFKDTQAFIQEAKQLYLSSGSEEFLNFVTRVLKFKGYGPEEVIKMMKN
jgi:tetratricopeptide (TPR) repeat protein